MNGFAPSLAALILALLAPAAAAYLDLGTTLTRDCRLARDPRRCAARLEAHAACRDKQGLERRRCQGLLLPPADCGMATPATLAARCQAQTAALAACRGKNGADFRRCMKTRLDQPFK